MKLLDLFCGAGGCSVGYARAGFDVYGVDIEPHPDYPFTFLEGDAMDDFLLDRDWMIDPPFEVIHASPPCQAYTTMSNRARGEWPDLLEPTLKSLKRWAARGWPRIYVVENVPGARSQMPKDSYTLHGGMFGLGVSRPRLFATNAFLFVPKANQVKNPVGVYGRAPDGRRLFTRSDGTEQRAPSSIDEGAEAMGIDWMTDWRDIAEAIPPAYTEFIGEQLMAHLEAAA